MTQKLFIHLGFIAALLLGAHAHAQKFEQLAKTPQLGWNSWNTFGCDVNEKMIREMADAMVSSGMKAAGYEYINIDDCWHGERDSNGFIQADKKHFPSGMKALADYVHSKGLKLVFILTQEIRPVLVVQVAAAMNIRTQLPMRIGELIM